MKPFRLVTMVYIYIAHGLKIFLDYFSEELMMTHVDPNILARTVRQKVRRSPETVGYDRRPLFTVRPREPEMDVFDIRPPPPSFSTVPPSAMSRRYDYDDVYRQQEREDEIYRRRLQVQQQAAAQQVFNFYRAYLFLSC